MTTSAYPICTRRPCHGGFPSEYCHAVWCGKTRIAWLPDGEHFLKICLFVLTESMNVTRRTHRRTDTTYQHRLHLHSIAQQQAAIKTNVTTTTINTSGKSTDEKFGWLHDTVVEWWSLNVELSLSYARPAAHGWPTRVGKPSAVGQPTRSTQPFIFSGSTSE